MTEYPVQPTQPAPSALSRTLVLACQNGLHMRVAARIVDVVRRYNSEVRFRSGRREADAKSLIGLIGLGAIRGEALSVTVTGGDAEPALEALTDLFSSEKDFCSIAPQDPEPDE